MITLREFKSGTYVDENPIYVSKPFVILGKEGIVLSAGTISEILSLSDYYDDCAVDIRRHDFYLNDNTKIAQKPSEINTLYLVKETLKAAPSVDDDDFENLYIEWLPLLKQIVFEYIDEKER